MRRNALSDLMDDLVTDYALLTPQFFKPDQKFIDWLVGYANGRMIIDVGSGPGIVTASLLDSGARICGLEPFADLRKVADKNMERMINGKEVLHILNRRIEQMPELFVGRGDRVLLLFARPCHSYFVSNALDMKDADTEALYITIPENLTRYNDLGDFHNEAILLNHEGESEDNEVVYSIR
jgi:hypothetical protein